MASVFSVPGDRVEAERRDGPLATAGHAASFLRAHGMGAAAVQDAARGLSLPLTLTMRGCLAPGQLLRPVLARERDQRAAVRLPLRR